MTGISECTNCIFVKFIFQKLPSKFKKTFADFEMMMDPSRNHRAYRIVVAKMLPPMIPFMPLLMKGITIIMFTIIMYDFDKDCINSTHSPWKVS